LQSKRVLSYKTAAPDTDGKIINPPNLQEVAGPKALTVSFSASSPSLEPEKPGGSNRLFKGLADLQATPPLPLFGGLQLFRDTEREKQEKQQVRF
jgi:hypothetical protein